MLRQRLTLVFTLLLIGATALLAKPIDLNQALGIAQQFFSTQNACRKQAVPTLRLCNLFADRYSRGAGSAPYYLFAQEEGRGFVIVTGDDLLPAIVGYSLDNIADAKHMPPALEIYLQLFEQYVNDIQAGRRNVSERKEGKGNVVGPLLTTKWSQSQPFNNLCPYQYVTGCVATSMAQIMNFHRWPDCGEGEVNHAQGGTLNFAEHRYDWANMKDEYLGEDSYTQDESDAVATLMRDCGCSVDMVYGANFSGTQVEKMIAALFDHFKYSPDMQCHSRSCYKRSSWLQLIRTELEARRPVNFSAITTGDNVGHSFVCDGIDVDNLLHINWGWGGLYDGYFDIDLMVPEGTGIGGGSGGYTLLQHVITGIRPITVTDGNRKPSRSLTAEGLTMSVEENNGRCQLKIRAERLANYGYQHTYVQPSILWHATDQSSERIQKGNSGGYAPVGYYTNKPWEGTFLINERDFPAPGDYPFTLINNEPTDDASWTPFFAGDRSVTGVATLHAGGNITFDLQSVPAEAVSLLSIRQESVSYAGISTKLAISARNYSPLPFSDDLYLAALPFGTDENNLRNYQDFLVTSIRGYIYGESILESSTSVTFSNSGRYRLRLCRSVWDENERIYVPIAEEEAQFIDVAAKPDYPIVVMDKVPLSCYEAEYPQELDVWFGMWFKAKSVGKNYEGNLQLWIHKNDEPADKETYLFSTDTYTLTSTSDNDYENFTCSTDCFYSMEQGDYTIYLKYFTGDSWVRVEGEMNQAKLRIVRSEKQDICLAGPIIVNEGMPVPLNSAVFIDIPVTSRSGFTGVVRLDDEYDDNGRTVPCFEPARTRIELASGETRTLRYLCAAGGYRIDYQPARVLVRPNVYGANDEYIGRLALGNYASTAFYDLVTALPTPFRIVVFPTIDNFGSLTPGKPGKLTVSLEADEDIDITLLSNFSPEGRLLGEMCPILRFPDSPIHLKAGACNNLEIPFVCLPSAPSGEHVIKFYVRTVKDNNIFPLNFSWVTINKGADDIVSIADKEVCVICRDGQLIVCGLGIGTTVDLVSVGGKILGTTVVRNEQVQLSTLGIPAGVYLLRFYNSDGTYCTQKVLLP